MADVSSRVTDNASITHHVIAWVVQVTMRPQLDLRMIQNEVTQVAVVSAVHCEVADVLFADTLMSRRMMSNNHTLPILVLREHQAEVVNRLMKPVSRMSRTQLGVTECIIADHRVILHHITKSMERQRIVLVTVSPQCSAQEGNIVNDLHFTFQKMNVREPGTFFAHMDNTCDPLAVIELVVAHDVDDIRELPRHSTEEVTETVSAQLARTQINVWSVWVGHDRRMVMEILTYHDIAGKDQYIGAFVVFQSDITKLKVKSLKVGSYCYTHTPDLFTFLIHNMVPYN